MANLGKIHKITDLREIWPNEEKDFSKWLAKTENLKELSATLGLGDIILEERESRVGPYEIDLYAK